jgi:5-methylcytosine-specific restriction endonuclease McrA
MDDFYESKPTPSDYWRGVILFGQNVASYKFALGRSLMELARDRRGASFVSLEELADPFSRHLVEHLREAPKQGTSPRSAFLDACRKYAKGEITKSELVDTTVRRGFNNVIDAFHVVAGEDVRVRFFTDERRGPRKGIELTDALQDLATSDGRTNLEHEVEARWRLVETAWEHNYARNVMRVDVDLPAGMLFAVPSGERRRSVTSVRGALNGYQKGRCFYCRGAIRVDGTGPHASHVDHFLPHKLAREGYFANLDAVWNLVLACEPCNGSAGKGMKRPDQRFFEKLGRRNEFLIRSHHPLREVLIVQTGTTPQARRGFLQDAYKTAEFLPDWSPT